MPLISAVCNFRTVDGGEDVDYIKMVNSPTDYFFFPLA